MALRSPVSPWGRKPRGTVDRFRMHSRLTIDGRSLVSGNRRRRQRLISGILVVAIEWSTTYLSHFLLGNGRSTTDREAEADRSYRRDGERHLGKELTEKAHKEAGKEAKAQADGEEGKVSVFIR